MTNPLYLDRLKEYLTEHYSNKKGLWNYSSNNTLADDWLLATPFNVFGVTYADFKQAVPGDYPLFNLSSQNATVSTQQSVPIQATVTKPGDMPVNLLEGHSYKLYDEMYSVMINAKKFLDITTLTPPTDRFLAALTNALTYISNKPEDQRPIVRILYSNWAANAAGFPDLLLNASEFLKKILQNVDSKKKLTVYAGAINAGLEKGITAWALSWNHSKIVAADGQTAIVGGHNMWGEHYLGKNPVFDVSMKVQGESATHAQDYADKLWGYVLWRINDSLFDRVQRASGLLPLVHTAAYVYDADARKSAITESYKSIPGPEPGTIIFVPNPQGQPDKDIYTRAKAAFSTQSGTIPILSIGREAGMDLSHVFPDRDSYLSEKGEPADQSMYQLFSMAENKIRMSLQSFSLHSALAPVEWYVVTWDYTLFYEMAKAVRRGVTIEVVLSNPNAIAGGLSKTEAPYDGEDVKNVNKRLRDVLIREFYLKEVEAEALVAQKFFVTNFRFSQDEMYPDNKGVKSIPLPNHAKTFMVDDRLFYIGSQNQYRCNLAEFGYVVEDATVARSYIDNYWTKLWAQSKRTLDATYDGSLEKFQNAEATVFILDLLDNKRLDKTWQKAIKDYTDATTDAKEPYLETLNDIISNAGYQTTADAVIELTKTPFFTNDRPKNQPNDESDRFVKDLLTQKALLIDFTALIDSIDGGAADSDKAVNQFLKDKKYSCTVLQVYASFVGIRGSNLNYFKGEYAGVVVQDGGEAFDFRSQAEQDQDKLALKRSLLSAGPNVEQMQKGPVLLIESDQLVKLDGLVILKFTYSDNILTWNQADGNSTSGSITFSEIPRPGLKDPFSGVECFGEIIYSDTGVAPLQGKISFYARKEAVKDHQPDPVYPPVGSPPDWPVVVCIVLGIAALLSALGVGVYFFYQKAKRNSEWRRSAREKKDDNYRESYELQPLVEDIGDSSSSERDRITSTEQRERSMTSGEVMRRRGFSGELINEANVNNDEGWASKSVQGEIKKDVAHYVTQSSKAINMDSIQSTFEQEFSELVTQSIVDDDYAKESSQVVENILNSDFRNLVRDSVDSIFQSQIEQSITKSIIERMGANDYKKYATGTIGSYLNASVQSQLSEPLVRRMETSTSVSGDQSYLENLLTSEVVTSKAEYLKNPGNKTNLQATIANQLSSIVNNQQTTSSEKQQKTTDLAKAVSDLSLTPSKENQDRVDQLTKDLDTITDREEKLNEDRREAEARRDELNTDKLDKKREEAKEKAKRERGEVFRHIE